MNLEDLAAETESKAKEPLEQDPGKISATGALGRKLTYTNSEAGTSEYGMFVRIFFVDENGEPGWFFSSAEILVHFFQSAKTADAFPFVARLRKEKGDYGKMWVELVQGN